MSDNSQMQAQLYKKISSDSKYFAWYFEQYISFENKNHMQLIEQLKIDESKFYYLSFCKVPNGLEVDFKTRLQKIADFIEINIFPLLQIIRSVDNINGFKQQANSVQLSLLAAREKESPNSPANE